MKTTPCGHRTVLHPCTLAGRNYQVDPYIGCEHYCHYCYVLPRAETDWRKEVLFHEDIAGRLEEALAGVPPQTIYMGWHTDPYQPCEAKCRQTRQVLELLLEKGFSASILTKSDLFLRDMDVLKSMENASVSVSVAFSDNDVRRLFEANTMDTEARVSALKELNSEGVRTAALICPVIPCITDVMRLIDWLEGHADMIWIYGLSILHRSDLNWQNVHRILEHHFPDVMGTIENAVFSRNHSYWKNLRQELLQLQKDRQLNLNIHV
jgi:DNA repair photolyase